MNGPILQRTTEPDGPPVRDPFGSFDAVLASRQRPMAERLELALSWNLLVSELAAGMAESEKGSTSTR